MLHDVVPDPGAMEVDELHARYLDELEATIAEVGVQKVAADSGLVEEHVVEIQNREVPEVHLEDAAAVLATRPGAPPAEDIAALARDALLMGMTNAVMDVDRLASAIGGEMEAKEIQSKVEGRFPMTLREFALLYHHVDRTGP